MATLPNNLRDYEASKYPERELQISIPVQMHDGSVKIFEVYGIQYLTSRSPAKGGVLVNPGKPTQKKMLLFTRRFAAMIN